jgi:Membrane domain of glycerophosphoryl diester phosphodiesterase
VRRPPAPDLRRSRDVGALFAHAFGIYLSRLGTFLAISAAIVVPVQLVVSGIGLREFTARYDSSPPTAQLVIPSLVSFLVIAPLITAACVYALLALDRGERPSAGRTLAAGMEAFTPIFVAIVLAAIGIAAGLVLLILPGVYLAVRWFFVPQAVVLQRAHGPKALRRSGELVEGYWWRTLGIVLLANLAAALPTFVLGGPFASLASHYDREVWVMVGSIVTETVTAPFVALLSTLLYFDLRARRGL